MGFRSQKTVRALTLTAFAMITVIGASSCSRRAKTMEFSRAGDDPFKPQLAINGGNAVTSSLQVSLKITLGGAGKPTKMYLTPTAGCKAGGTWQSFSATSAYTLGKADSVNTVYASVSDASGSVSDCVSAAITHISNDPFKPTLTINGGNAVTSSKQVSLKITLGGTATPDRMYVTSTPGCTTGGSWQAFSATSAFTIPTSDALNMVYVAVSDATGAVSACVSASITHATAAALTVDPIYPNHANWMDYVHWGAGDAYSQADVACDHLNGDVSPRSCLHAGEKRRVELPRWFACSKLTLTEELSAFDWTCNDSGATTRFDMIGLKAGKGLRDLIDYSNGTFKGNRVTVAAPYSETFSSSTAAWWSNPIILKVAADVVGRTNSWTATSTIYALTESADTKWIRVGTKSALVMPRGTELRHTDAGPGITQCVAGVGTCAVWSKTQYSWIEGDFRTGASGTHDYGVMVPSTLAFHVTVRASTISGFAKAGVQVLQGASATRLIDIDSSRNLTGIAFDVSNYSFVQRVRLAQNSSTGIASINNPLGLVLQQVIAGANLDQGIGTASFRQLTATLVTSSLNGGSPSLVERSGIWMDGVNGATFHNAIVVGAMDYGYWANNSQNLTFSQTASDVMDGLGPKDDISLNAVSSIHVTGNLLANRCFDSVGNQGFFGTAPAYSCGVSGGDSDHHFVSVNNLLGAFSGAVGSDSNLPGGSSGIATGTISNWTRFDNFFRFWTRPSSADYGPCDNPGNCSLLDSRLSSSDTKVFNRTADGQTANAAFVAGQPCPAQLSGNVISFDLMHLAIGGGAVQQVFLRNAVEILNDGFGNENGLCESGERCLYTPNFGAYQGEGDYTSNECIFQDGTVTGVRMFAFPTNGVSP